MSARPSSSDVQVTPAQVWPALSSELRTRIVNSTSSVNGEYGGAPSGATTDAKGGVLCSVDHSRQKFGLTISIVWL